MKKILLFLCVNLVTSLLCAEQMQFITTLSSPLGTFAQLETADHTAVTSVPLVNFCNTRSAAGTVTLKGANVYLQTLNLKNNTTLGGNTAEFRISNALSVNNDATVTGGRLMANAATVSGASSAKSNVEDTLHMSGMKVKGAKTSSLTIPGQVQSSGSGDGTELEWSNIYTKDYKSDGAETGSNTYTSYLLKSKAGTVEPEPCEGYDCCDPDTEPSPEDKICNQCGRFYAYVECNEQTRQWDVSWESECSVSDARECYNYRWEDNYKETCLISCFMDYHTGGSPITTCRVNSDGCWGWMGERLALGTIVGRGGDADITDCNDMIDQLDVWKRKVGINITSAQAASRVCTYEQEGQIGFLYTGNPSKDLTGGNAGCVAYTCVKGSAKY